jgi:hypothetical protein
MLTIDHLAVTAASLKEGVAYVEQALGVDLAEGGRHSAMGTHNRLLSLGPGLYLEVIAIDPQAEAPSRPRWFDLDRFRGQPRLSNWVARCDDLDAALSRAPEGVGRPLALARGDLRWQMAVPDDGRLPWDGLFPALMAWEGEAHPAQRLPESQCRLSSLKLFHPDADGLARALTTLVDDPRITVENSSDIGLRASFATVNGERILT